MGLSTFAIIDGADVPIRLEDIPRLELMLRSCDPLTPGPSTIVDRYRVGGYWANPNPETELEALLDNNILTRVLGLIEGGSELSESDRNAAATMAFLTSCNFKIEPAISLHEKSQTSSRESPVSTLALFRVADNVHPQAYLDVAIGRSDHIHSDAILAARTMTAGDDPDRAPDFKDPVPNWRYALAATLKMVLIWRAGGNGKTKLKRLVSWMQDEWCYSAPALMFASLLYSPRCPKGLLKGVGSNDDDKALAGAKNAAWDIAYCQNWTRSVSSCSESQIKCLCTLDAGLRTVARSIFMERGLNSDEQLRLLLSKNWGEASAKELWEHYSSEIQKRTPGRRHLVHTRKQNVENLLRALEFELRSS